MLRCQGLINVTSWLWFYSLDKKFYTMRLLYWDAKISDWVYWCAEFLKTPASLPIQTRTVVARAVEQETQLSTNLDPSLLVRPLFNQHSQFSLFKPCFQYLAYCSLALHQRDGLNYLIKYVSCYLMNLEHILKLQMGGETEFASF